ncbi:MAG: hypothetical protein M1839_000373 [Geoglossum umbratile]|nr:MAG: hypothetical protein M1839_000373 [Geoglossum umbratile]
MPHKHRRSKAAQEDGSQFELPPTALAKPLPAATKSASKPNPGPSSSKVRKKAKRKPKNRLEDDDTPKAFSRLLQFQKTGRYPSGLDDGQPAARSKKRKRSDTSSAPPPPIPAPKPTILPGERLSSFSARVDAALPLSGLVSKHASRTRGDPVPGVRAHRTKLERRMHKMYDEWRAADARMKEKRFAALEEEEGEGEGDGDGDGDEEGPVGDFSTTKKQAKKRKSKRARRTGVGGDESDGDPWAQLLTLRNEPVRRALNDVVQAPPQLTIPKPRLSALAGVPKAAGSQRRREVLGSVRKDVVEGYRALMEGRRSGGGGGGGGGGGVVVDP